MNPSLLLIPDRYKAAKLYSQIPDSGAGDLTFARNSNATRVNSAGLIEKVRTNLFAYSQEFNDAYWSKSGGGGAAAPVITANNTTAPDGTNTAEKIDLPALSGTQFSIISREPSVSGIHNASVFLRGAVGGEVVYLFWTPDGVNYVRVSCTLTTAWQRFNLSATTATNWGFGIGVDLRDSSQDDQAAQTFFVWGAQLEAGDIATDYIPTTTAAVSVGITADIPRLDYTGGGCPSLLLEPQRTNLVANSEVTSGYSTFGSVFTQNTATSPQGFVNADTMAGNGASTQIFGATPITFPSAGQVTISVFAKANTASFIDINIDGFAGASNIIGIFNLAAGTTASSGASIQNYGNGWYRCILTATIDAGDLSGFMAIDVRPSVASLTWPSAGDANGKSVFVWGFQAELGSYPTSYIPTLGASVTRLADAASKTGISSLIGGTEGTLYAEIPLQYLNFVNFRGIISASDGTFDNGAFVFVNNDGGTSNQFSSVYRSAGSTVAVFQAANLSAGNIGSTYKIAIAYKANDFVFYINGVQIGSDTSGSITGTLSQLDLGSISYTGLSTIDRQSIAASAIYPVRLSNSELASLTSL